MRMNGYYYSFNSTGVQEIDTILSAVACAGKACHHTEDWEDKCDSYEPEHFGGDCPVEWIQDAANRAAASWRAQLKEPGA